MLSIKTYYEKKTCQIKVEQVLTTSKCEKKTSELLSIIIKQYKLQENFSYKDLITFENQRDKLDKNNMDFSHTDDVKIQNNEFNQYKHYHQWIVISRLQL